MPSGFNGISVLVNDVERSREYGIPTAEHTFTWTQDHSEETDHFRFWCVRSDAGSSIVRNPTSAELLDVDGSWTGPVLLLAKAEPVVIGTGERKPDS